MIKNIVILGSDNQLGKLAYDFFRKYKNKYNIVALKSDSNNQEVFLKQIKETKAVYNFQKTKMKIDINSLDLEGIYFKENEEFENYIISNQVDIIISALSDINSVKTILSAINEYKDIALLDPSPVLYTGHIIPREAKNKGVKFQVLSYPIYSLDQFLKFRQINEIHKIYLYTTKNTKKSIDPIDYNNFYSFQQKYFSINKIRIANEVLLSHYIYDIPIDLFSFFEQSKIIFSVDVQFKDGSNLINATTKDLENIFNYYFLDSKNLSKVNIPTFDKLNVSFKLLDKKYEAIEIIKKVLLKKGSAPIVYFIALKKLLSLIYENKLKEDTDIFKIIRDVLSKKTYSAKYPDLSSIFAIEKRLNQYIEKNYL